MANPSARIQITAEDKASRVIANVRQELLGLSGVGSRLGALLGPLGGIAGGVAALGAGVYAIQQFVSGIDDLADTAEGLGTTAVALAELRSKAAEAGVESAVLDNALGKLNNKIGDAVAGNEKAVATFQAMGVAFADAAGNARPTEQVLGDIADRMRTYANTAEKAALMSEVFGEKVGRRLGAYLNQGSEGLRQFTGLTEDTVREASKLQVEIDKLANSWERLKNTVLGAAVPAINRLIEAFGQGTLAEQIAQVEQELRGLEQRGYGNPTYVENLRAQLARLKGELRDEDLQRFLSGGNAARKADMPTIAPRLPGASAAGGRAGARAEEIDDERRALAQYIEELQRQQVSLEGITETEKALRVLRGLGALGEVEQVRALVLQQAELVDGLRAEEQVRRHIDEVMQEVQANEAAAEARFQRERDRLAELEGLLTSAQRQRLSAIYALQEAGELTEQQVVTLTNDVYGLATATTAAKDSAADFGFTFSSALEDIIVNGGKAGDVIRALEQDIVRMMTRKMVTEPMGNAVSGFFGRAGATLSGGGSFFDALADGFIKVFGMASGGSVTGGHPYLIGEKGPELFVPSSSGSIVPNHRLGGGTTINISVASGTSRETASQIAAAVGRQMAITQARAF